MSGFKKYACRSCVSLLAIILLFGFIRVRLLGFPLERDEGEYAYIGQLILHGLNPYRFCHTMKLPGTAAAYALIMAVFGQTTEALHLGLLLVNTATTLCMYFLGNRLMGRTAGVVTAASFALLSAEPSVLGFAGHATQFVLLPAVGGIVLLLKAIESRRMRWFFASGLLLGLGFLMKQPGFLFLMFALVYLAWHHYARLQGGRVFLLQAGMLLLGGTLPFALTCLGMLATGSFETFWFWTVTYSGKYAFIIDVKEGFPLLGQNFLKLVTSAPLVWLVAAGGIITLFVRRRMRGQAIFLLGFLVFSFAAVCPGLYFRKHYFMLLLPAVSLLCAAAVRTPEAEKSLKTTVPLALFLAAFMLSLVQQKAYFFEMAPTALSRSLYPGNAFAEMPTVSDFIKRRSAPGDRIAVLGSEPELYFYTGLLSATRYIYMYPLMEPQPFAATMQQEMIAEIEAARPRFIVSVGLQMSWLSRPGSDRRIIHWSESYIHGHYRLVGIADMFEHATEYRWDEDARSYRPRSALKIYVFEKIAPL